QEVQQKACNAADRTADVAEREHGRLLAALLAPAQAEQRLVERNVGAQRMFDVELAAVCTAAAPTMVACQLCGELFDHLPHLGAIFGGDLREICAPRRFENCGAPR